MTCAFYACVAPVRAFSVCRVHLARTLEAGRRSTVCTPKTVRLDRLILTRYVNR